MHISKKNIFSKHVLMFTIKVEYIEYTIQGYNLGKTQN